MKRRTAIQLLAMTSAVAQPQPSRTQIITSAMRSDDRSTLEISFGTSTAKFTAPDEREWDQIVLSSDGLHVFSVQLHRHGSGAWIEDVHEFALKNYLAQPSTYQLRSIPLKTTLESARVMDIFASSADGSRLLVGIHYAYLQDGRTAFYQSYPHFFDTKTGEITAINP